MIMEGSSDRVPYWYKPRSFRMSILAKNVWNCSFFNFFFNIFQQIVPIWNEWPVLVNKWLVVELPTQNSQKFF